MPNHSLAALPKIAPELTVPLVEMPKHLPKVNFPAFLSGDTLNVVFYGMEHPFFLQDDVAMKTFGYNLSHLSANFHIAFPFNTGQNLANTLTLLTELGYTIGNVCIAGHSGYYGYFVQEGAGFYVNHYNYRKKGRSMPFNEGVLLMKDLAQLINEGDIRLASNSLWVLAGCNTSSRNPSFANELVRISGRATISANQKVDLFNVPKIGLYLRGTEGGTFLVHQWNAQTQKVEKLDLETESIQIDEAIKAYNRYRNATRR